MKKILGLLLFLSLSMLSIHAEPALIEKIPNKISNKMRLKKQTSKESRILKIRGIKCKVFKYSEKRAVGTFLQGPMKGSQFYIDGPRNGLCTNYEKKGKYTIHYYKGGKVITYKNKQMIKPV